MAMAQSDARMLTGSVTYRERMALPDNAQITVAIEDISIADRAAVAVGQTSFSANGKQVPFTFSIPYRSDQVLAGRTYAVRARIMADGKLLFSSTAANVVRLDGQDLPVQMVLQRIVERPIASSIESTPWIPYEIKGVKVIPVSQREFSLKFDSSNRKFGAFVGVNQMGGMYDLSGNRLSFKEVFSTLMAGPSELMEQESRFKKMLEKVTKAKVFGDKLVLYAGDEPVIKAKTGGSP